ncbi:MAG: peptidoglycan editing factor PgeF [Eubacterium sp.]|nr:peptidoglycan editing factor PgeF [Candidatus Colimonas fimequi]
MMTKTYLEVFPQYEEIKGFFTYKGAAVDGSPYDNPALVKELGLEGAMLVWPKQVHKNDIAVIREKTGASIRIPDTDGVVTDQKNVLLTTVHADCLPVFFYDLEHEAIGVVHAGWRGTNLGIAPKCVKVMGEEYGTRPEDVQVFIGPGICADCFEVGPEVRDEFAVSWPFIDEYAVPKGEKYYIDLKGVNKRELTDIGVLPEHIEVTEHCTYHEPELFVSYRREGGTKMRLGAGLCIKEK